MRTTAPPVTVADPLLTLAPFVDAGVFGHADVHVAGAIARLVPESDPWVILAAAMAARVTRLGHVCLLLDDPVGSIIDGVEAADDPDAPFDDPHDENPDPLSALTWPEPAAWAERLAASPAACTPHDLAAGPPAPVPPLVLDGNRLYLERYWQFETTVADDLLDRSTGIVEHAEASATLSDLTVARLFRAADPMTDPLQRQAVEAALRHRLVVIGGGPGTGKTTTIAKVLAAVDDIARSLGDERGPLEIALAAPTGKAAARMTEAIQQAAVHITGLDDAVRTTLGKLQASTIHRLLGSRGGLSFRHDRHFPLTADVVVIDEASMISLPLMARLLDAVRPDARLVLLGDPNQLASIEAGAVLGDIVKGATMAPTDPTAEPPPLRSNVVLLERVFRVDEGAGAITRLASTINSGDADDVLDVLSAGGNIVRWIHPDDPAAIQALVDECASNAAAVVRAAFDGDAEEGLARLLDLKVLAATHRGQFGVDDWRQRIETAASALVPRLRTGARWYVGRPVLVTSNDRINGLNNGDTGLVVADGTVALGTAGVEPRFLQPSQVASSATWWSMTIHKSQGSEFDHAVVSPPLHQSPIITRELLYTAVTRARSKVTVIASPQTLRDAVERRITRASGLADRLATRPALNGE